MFMFLEKNAWNDVSLRDDRYNQVIHMVSAAKGAEMFYQTDGGRYEGIELAKQLDDFSSQAWVGHPYYDVIDNSTDFETKVTKVIASICHRLGMEVEDRLSMDSRKRKFLVSCLPDEKAWTTFEDFIVVYDYLVTPSIKSDNQNQAHIRRRGQDVKWDDQTKRWNLETGNWKKARNWSQEFENWCPEASTR